MKKFEIERIDGTIAYLNGFEIEQINTADFIIFRVDKDVIIEEVKRIIAGLKSQGVKKSFIILPKQVEYCVFKKEKSNGKDSFSQ